MQRFALDIDSVAYIRNLLNGKNPDPVHALVLAELGGAESIVCYLRDDLKTVNDRDVALFRQVIKTYLNVRTNLTEENIRKLMRVKPDMITLVAPGEISVVEPISLDMEMYSSQIHSAVVELRSSNILSSALIEPDISQIKLAGRLEFDYIEINANCLSEAADMNSELEILERLSGLTLAASKIGMGVNISGNIGYDNIREISAINYIEDIIVGKPILSKALSIGFEQAVRDIMTLL
jgi:pyridoxine 5-phosphate synthase